jgi:radical SAM protein with 4Fe4S-binding SPASM domain
MWSKSNNYIIQGNGLTKEMDMYHIIVAPTYACNLRCKHCYLPDHKAVTIQYEEMKKLLLDWNEITLNDRGQYGGIFHLKGGEPLIVPYLEKLIKDLIELKSQRFMVTTNGTIFKDKFFSLFAECLNSLDGNILINVSIDGAAEYTHDAIRGKGNYRKTIKFLKILAGIGIPVHINFVINRMNLPEVEEILELAKDNNVIQVNFLPFVSKGYGASISELVLTPLEIHEKIEAIFSQTDERTRLKLTGTISDVLRTQAITGKRTCECVVGYKGLYHITPKGDVFSCPNLMDSEFSMGNIFEKSLKDIHEKEVSKLYEKLKNKSSLSDYTCKGAIKYYEKAGKKHMVESNSAFNEFLNSKSNDTTVAGELSFCFSRNL